MTRHRVSTFHPDAIKCLPGLNLGGSGTGVDLSPRKNSLDFRLSRSCFTALELAAETPGQATVDLIYYRLKRMSSSKP